MNRFLSSIILCILSTAFSACGVALTPKLTAKIPPKTETEVFRLNFIQGEAQELFGLNLGIVNETKKLIGAQVGIANFSGETAGIQLGLVNSSQKPYSSSLPPPNDHWSWLVSFQAGLINVRKGQAGTYATGVQLGVVNSNSEYDNSGIALGILNSRTNGLAVAPLLNIQSEGILIGTLNFSSKGLNIGAVNIAAEGFNIGLINTGGKDTFSIGLINLCPSNLLLVVMFVINSCN
ncbi:putative lipoprotein [Leptospira noguchii str. 2006001870]|uniref:LA_2272/LA_2273 family lipoprotein n=1 Tax=Leptospira noguchii TaxID=28182 RepID=UPI000248849E|nr:hypothetical protein [Leptospira noguchii]EKR72854.1 putative lipoprotein [Leptospira noguchii str. 2006001870]